MFSTEDIIFLIISAGELIVGLLGNGFIGLVTCIDWIKKKKLFSIDYILISLAISRICLICVTVLHIILLEFYPDYIINEKLRLLIGIVWAFSNQSTSWFGTCLSVYYLLKIANFSHQLFLWLKWRIDRAVVHILLGCLTISLLIILPIVIILGCDYQLYIIKNQKSNFTEMFDMSKFHYFYILNIFVLLGIVPLTVSLISFFLLIISLCIHTKQMKNNVTGCRDPSMTAHLGAMKMVISFLFLCFVYYLATLLVSYSYLMIRKKLSVLLGTTVSILYPSVHSLILILGYNKLRQASARMLICGKRACLF